MIVLQTLLDAAHITSFKAAEFYSRKAKGAPRDVVPPDELLENIIPTAILAQEIRTRYGKPIRISAYRDPNYNRIVGGGANSEHLQFKAIDLFPAGKFSKSDLLKLKAIAQDVVEAASKDGMRTGFGIYKGFVHIDTGSTKARRRRWFGKGV